MLNRADLFAIACLLLALALGFSEATHRLPAELAYAAAIGDQRPPLPEYARQPSANAGQDVGSTPTASTNGGAPDSTDGATRDSRRYAPTVTGQLHNRQRGDASGGLNAVSAGGATAFLRASQPGARPGTHPQGATHE